MNSIDPFVRTAFLPVASLVVFFSGVSPAAGELDAAGELEQFKGWIAKTYAEIVHATYADALAGAVELRGAVVALTAGASEAALEEAREVWVRARRPYLETEVFRFYGGPIDGDDGPEGMINAWPMDESYVDYVVGAPGAGIINRPAQHPSITTKSVAELNEKEGETNIASGFHAIEFLLWGQDLDAGGPGARPASDYSTGAGAARRGAYLRACADLLVENLSSLVDAWAPGAPGNYRAGFLAEDPDEALARIVAGTKTLAGHELAGERLLVAYDTQAQEDEHSCFSDSTRQDAVHDMIGVENVYLGRYRRTDGTEVSGPSLRDLAETIDPELKRSLDAAVRRARAATEAVPDPFDQAILGADGSPGRMAVLAAIEALEALDGELGKLADGLGFELPSSGDVEG